MSDSRRAWSSRRRRVDRGRRGKTRWHPPHARTYVHTHTYTHTYVHTHARTRAPAHTHIRTLNTTLSYPCMHTTEKFAETCYVQLLMCIQSCLICCCVHAYVCSSDPDHHHAGTYTHAHIRPPPIFLFCSFHVSGPSCSSILPPTVRSKPCSKQGMKRQSYSDITLRRKSLPCPRVILGRRLSVIVAQPSVVFT